MSLKRGSRQVAGRGIGNPLAARFREIERAIRRPLEQSGAGIPGPAGPMGPTGAAGATGATGSAGATGPAGPAAPTARSDRTAGDLILNSTTWANVDTGMDLVLAAATGDWVEVGLAGLWNNAAVTAYLDVVSLVAGSPVTSWALDVAPNNTHAPGIWVATASQFVAISGSTVRQLDAGDISGGNVTLRVRYRTLTAANKGLFAVANTPFSFWAKNLLQP